MDFKTLGYNDKLINLESPLARPLGQDALTFDGRLVDTGIKLGPNSVTTTTISDGAVTQTKVASNSITGSNIIDGGIGQNDIASNVLQGTHITGNAITGTHIADGGIGSIDIASNNIHGSHLSGSAVVGTHIGLLAVTNAKINDYDLAKGTGNSINVINSGTFGTIRGSLEFNANGTAGISTIATIVDRDSGIGTTTHTLTFTYGLLTAYGTA